MNLQISSKYCDPGVPITFPAATEQVQEKIAELNGADQDMIFIRGDGPVWHFGEYVNITGPEECETLMLDGMG